MGKAKVSSGKDLTTGPIGKGILAFAIPLFWGSCYSSSIMWRMRGL